MPFDFCRAAIFPRYEMLQYALEYARRGWPVFPLLPGRKEPAIPKSEGGRGYLDATTDEAIIRAWWKRWPDANIGFCPEYAGLFAIDIERECADTKAYPDTLEARSASGGTHLLYQGSGPSTVKKIGLHVDTRGVGGYIVLAPSKVDTRDEKAAADPTRCGSYEWTELRKPAPIPAWLIQKLNRFKSTGEPRRTPSDREIDTPERLSRVKMLCHARPPGVIGLGSRMATLALANSCLDWCSHEVVIDAVVEHWMPRCRPEGCWDEEWITKIVNSIRQRSNGSWVGRHDDVGCNENGGTSIGAYDPSIVSGLLKGGSHMNGSPAVGNGLNKSPRKLFQWRTPEEAANAPPLTYWDDQKTMPKVPGILVVSGPQKTHKTGLVIKKCLDALDRGAFILYVAAEGGYGIDTARLPKVRDQRGWPWDKLNAKWRTLAAPFNILVQLPSLIEEAPFTPNVVVFDTLTRVAGAADLNTAQAVQMIYGACDHLMETWGCLVIFIHHPKRDGKGASGSVQIENSAYATWHISVENETEVICWVDKMKDGKAEFEVRYRADMSNGAPVILDEVRRDRPMSSVRYTIEQVLAKIPTGETVNIQFICDRTGLSQDAIEAHVRGRKDKKGVFRSPDCAHLCAGEFVPKHVKDWMFLGFGVQ
jgi:hypothetical protein